MPQGYPRANLGAIRKSLLVLVLFLGCRSQRDEDVLPPQITHVGVDEDSEVPLFGGQAEEAPGEGLLNLNESSVDGAADGVPKPKKRARLARTSKPSPLVRHTSQVMVGDAETLPLHALEATARVDGRPRRPRPARSSRWPMPRSSTTWLRLRGNGALSSLHQ